MGLYIRGGRYYFRKKIEGKVYYKALGIKKGQENLLSERLKQVEDEVTAKHYGLSYKPYHEVKFLDYCEKYLKSKLYKKTLHRDRQYLHVIGEIWRDLPLSVISKKHTEKLEAALFKRKLKPSSVNRYFEILRHLFNMAIEDGHIKENPCKFYIPYVEDGQRKPLTREELSRILEAASFIQEHPRSQLQSIIYDLIIFALSTGMRLSEILKLKKSYIRDDIVFYPITETKYRRRVYSQNKKVKAVCLNKIAMGIITKQKNVDDYVFPLKWRDANVIRKTMARIREDSGVQDFTFHQLRHTVSTVVASQVNLAAAKTILGHSDIKTTLKYTHPGIEEQRKGVAKIGEFVAALISPPD